MIKRLIGFLTFQNVFQMIHIGSVSDPDPGSVGSVIFSRIRIRIHLENNGSGSRSQICQKMFIFEQNFNKFKAKNAKFLLNVQGFE